MLVFLGCQDNLANLGQEVSDARTDSHPQERTKKLTGACVVVCVREKNKEKVEGTHG